MPEMRPVYSSHIDAIGYDADQGGLHVLYSNGKTAVHAVPPDVAQQVLTAPSIGEAMHAFIRGKYSHRYLDDAP